ncbi:MAG: hypothetical protein LBL74_08210 [Bacteroidales bacterium]|jgi:ribosome maturation factor RimP|nr:hypothetical protein [Bacteroidales bacterium]
MVGKEKVLEAASQACEMVNEAKGSAISVSKVTVNKANNIVVFLNNENGVTIDDCANVSKAFETLIDREAEDYSLTVSSMGSN